jgi:Putative auto-transporter adhesin, head GIN domain
MKTSIKNLFAVALTSLVLTSSAFAATDVKSNQVTVLNQVKNISKIEVKGNVEIILVQAPVESVKVYDSYYAKNALVQQQDGVLRISSFQKETLTVAVYVRNLSSIEAADNATVTTLGKVNFLSLNVVLTGKAKADLNASTVSLTTVVKDNAILNLGGYTTDLYATMGSQANLNMEKFKADCSSVNSIAPVYAKATPVKKVTLESIGYADDLAK